VAAGVVVSFAGQPGEEARWPTWRGAGRDGKSRETGLLKAWPEGGPKLLWRAAECGQGFSSVAVAGGLIYTAGDVDGRSCVVALGLDGKLKWRAPNGPAWRVPRSTGWAGSFDGTRATPTFDDGRVYHLSALGRLGCFDAKTGRELWAVDVTKRFRARRPIWGYAESVLIDGEKLYVYPGGSEGYMVALDRKTGKVVWANKTIGRRAAYGSAVLVADGGVRQLITLTATAAIGVDAETGKLLWTHRHVNRHKDNVNTPIYHKGSVFICSGYERGGELLKLTYGKGRVGIARIWANRRFNNLHGGVILHDGRLYGDTDRGSRWLGVDFKSGETVWQGKGVGNGCATFADGMLYCLGHRGTMALAKPSAAGLRIVSRFRVPKGGRNAFWARPVVCGGRLYVRHAARLYAYDVSAKKPTR